MYFLVPERSKTEELLKKYINCEFVYLGFKICLLFDKKSYYLRVNYSQFSSKLNYEEVYLLLYLFEYKFLFPEEISTILKLNYFYEL